MPSTTLIVAPRSSRTELSMGLLHTTFAGLAARVRSLLLAALLPVLLLIISLVLRG